jgi:hypothetical protein
MAVTGASEGSRVICITGMHCGGTSAVARIVNLLGVDLGPQDEVSAPAPGYNTRGLWEYLELTRVADAILRMLDGSWDRPPPLEPGWQHSDALEPHRRRAAEVVNETFADSALWGWKDPRSSLLLPFWEDVVGPVDLVVAVRSPLDVAGSLAVRNGIERDRALALWERYARGMIAGLASHPASVIAYEDVWRGPDAFAPLAEFLGKPGGHQRAEFRAAAADWLDPTMWHHRAGHKPDTADAGLSHEQRALYRTLLSYAQ